MGKKVMKPYFIRWDTTISKNWKAEVERTAEVTQNATIFSLTQEYWDAIQRLIRLADLGILITFDSIIIHGSLGKFLKDENISTLTFWEIRKAIRRLERETGICFENAIIKSIECGVSIITRHQPAEYLKLFRYPARYTRHEYATITGVETITYSTPIGAYQFTGYNKVLEVERKKKQYIPSLLKGANILRLEY